MATIALEPDETEEGKLPFVCMRCGLAAIESKKTLFYCALPGGTVAGAGAILLQKWVYVPLCARHQNHWRNRNRARTAIYVGGLAVLVVYGSLWPLLLQVFQVEERGGAFEKFLYATILPIAGMLFLGALIFLGAYRAASTSLRALQIADEKITIGGVSPAFVEALAEQRRRR